MVEMYKSDKSIERALEKKVLWKLDWHIMPLVTIVCLASFLDRTNIGNARIAGLEEDLHLHGTQFNVALAVFFITYILSELPSNMVIKSAKPNRLLGFLIASWGTVTALTSLTRDYESLVVVRFFLGLFEGGLSPGVLLYLSCIYKRHELQTRIGIYYAAVPVAGTLGGFFAYAILHMDGIGKIAGWRWLFILEGIATIPLAFLVVFLLPSDVASAKFLTKEERDYASWRLKQAGEVANISVQSIQIMPKDASDEYQDTPNHAMKTEYFELEHEVFEWREVRRGLFDVLTWINGLAFFGITTSLYSFALFFPTIVAGLGYSGYQAQLHTVPPNILAAFFSVTVSILCDRLKLRGPFVVMLLPLSMMGYIIIIEAKTNLIRYIGSCFIATGTAAAIPCIVTIIANNNRGHYKRATAIAVQVAFASAGGLAATFIYTQDQAPLYTKGHSISLSLVALAWVMSIGHVLYSLWENKARREGRRDSNITKYKQLCEAGLTNAPIGDRHPDFTLAL